MYNKFKIYLGLKEKTGAYIHWTTALESVLNELDTHQLDGATIYEATGVWKGETEPTMIVEILSIAHIEPIISKIASNLRDEFAQECVMVTTEHATLEFV